MQRVRNFPVGRVEFLHLHPLNFEEYLMAKNMTEALVQLRKTPYDEYAKPVLLKLFNQYAIIGGMPEIISRFIETESITVLPRIYESIWGTYKRDVEKYSSNKSELSVIKHIMSSAHLYVDQRIKFQNFGKSNYRSREVGEAFRNLDMSKVIQLIYPTTSFDFPVIPDIGKSPRLQFLDTGLVNHELGIQSDMLSFSDLSGSFRGAIIPHLISQEIISLNTIKYDKPNFWVREKKQSSAEVDLVYTYKNKVIPIEIKSGKDGTLRSLHQFVERSHHPYAVRIYGGEFKIIKTKTPGGKPYLLMNLPYFLGTQIKKYMEYFVENYRMGTD
jgi:predicted AAA+ superfamily ATPase